MKNSIKELGYLFNRHLKKENTMRKFELLKDVELMQHINTAKQILDLFAKRPKTIINPFMDIRFEIQKLLIELDHEEELRNN